MPDKDRIAKEDWKRRESVEPQLSEPQEEESQSVDAEIRDYSPEFTHNQTTARYLSPDNKVSRCVMESSDLIAIARLAASTPHLSGRVSPPHIREGGAKHIIVNGAFPLGLRQPGVLVETIRDPQNPGRMVFLRWENGRAATFPFIEWEGRTFIPPDPTSSSFPTLSLPVGLLPCGDPSDVLGGVGDAISRFVKLPFQPLQIVAAFVLASWFSDYFEAAPYLWIVGPPTSAKTKLLMVLWCMCRRGLIVGDLRPGSIYKLEDTWNPTLTIDEFELGSSVASSELLRMLRTGSAPAVPTFRNGRQFSTYGLKVIVSRQPCNDAALLSRGLVISMLPAKGNTPPLDEAAMHGLEREWQPKLCMFRLQNSEIVKNHCHSLSRLQGLSGRMRQIGLALTAPFGEHHECLSRLHAILNEHDEEDRIERSLEPEWLVAESLLATCHEQLKNGIGAPCISVGSVAVQVNKNLEYRHEEFRLSAKKAGLVLKSLGLRTGRLGNCGRGLTLTTRVKEKIHEVAAQLRIDRRMIAPLATLESGHGCARCALCEELGLTGGLHFD